tara:strand:- start:131 stop:313 length:183 start_codon:yes stop_codon:yes gene_type:complete
MKEPLDDSTTLLAIAFTLLIVFTLIFSFGKNDIRELDPSIQWRDNSLNNSQNYESQSYSS